MTPSRFILLISFSFLTQPLHSMERPLYSLVEDVRSSDGYCGPEANDTLYLLLNEFDSEEKLSKNWETLEPRIEPILNQTWKICGNPRGYRRCEAPIVFAAKKGLITFISYVFKQPDLPIDQASLDQALHGAVMYDHQEVAYLLLEKGADPNGYVMPTRIGYTTLDAVFGSPFGPRRQQMRTGNYKLAKALLLLGAKGSRIAIRYTDYSAFSEAWEALVTKHPDLKMLYALQTFFGTANFSLERLALLHFVLDPHGRKLPLESLPRKLIEHIEKLRSASEQNQALIPRQPTEVRDGVNRYY